MIISTKQEMAIYALALYFSLSTLGDTGSYIQAGFAYLLTVIDSFLVVLYLEGRPDGSYKN